MNVPAHDLRQCSMCGEEVYKDRCETIEIRGTLYGFVFCWGCINRSLERTRPTRIKKNEKTA